MPWAWWVLILVIATNAVISFRRARKGERMNPLPPVASALLALIGALDLFPYGVFWRVMLAAGVTGALVWFDAWVWGVAYTMGRGPQRS